MEILDYQIRKISVSHPKNDENKFVMNLTLVCKANRLMSVNSTIQHDGAGSDPILRDAVVDVCSPEGTPDKIAAMNAKITNAPNNHYELTQTELKALMKYGAFEDNLLDVPNCEYRAMKLPRPVCMKYRTALNNHAAGEWVMQTGTNYVKLYDTFYILVRHLTAAQDSAPVAGFEPEKMLDNILRNYLPLEVAAQEGVLNPSDAARWNVEGAVSTPGVAVPQTAAQVETQAAAQAGSTL